MRALFIVTLVCLSACKPSRDDQLGKVLVRWGGAECAAFLAERGWAAHEKPRVDDDGSVQCEGVRHDEHVIINVNHAFTASGARDAAALFKDSVKYSVKAFGTVFVQTRQSTRMSAEALLDACVAAGRFDEAGLRACITKQGWVFDDKDEDACVSSESSTRCDATKKQVYGRAYASLYADSLGGAAEAQRAYRLGVAHWSRNEWSLSVKVDDYDATREWMQEIEKVAAAGL